jgi:hypothetical protein
MMRERPVSASRQESAQAPQVSALRLEWVLEHPVSASRQESALELPGLESRRASVPERRELG